MEYSEKEDKELDLRTMADTIVMLSAAIQTQNDVLLTLLHNLDLKIPDWKTKEELEKDVGPKVQACVKAVRKVYGRSEADKD